MYKLNIVENIDMHYLRAKYLAFLKGLDVSRNNIFCNLTVNCFILAMFLISYILFYQFIKIRGHKIGVKNEWKKSSSEIVLI